MSKDLLERIDLLTKIAATIIIAIGLTIYTSYSNELIERDKLQLEEMRLQTDAIKKQSEEIRLSRDQTISMMEKLIDILFEESNKEYSQNQKEVLAFWIDIFN